MSQTNFLVNDVQRDRAVAHLQGLYAQGVINDDELDRRLTLALDADNRTQLNSSLQGLARIAPAVLTRPVPGAPTPAENVGAGLIHLAALPTWFLVPAIAKALARPGSRTWWEAGRALSLQLALGGIWVASIVLAALFGAGEIIALAWLIWLVSTIVAAVRTFNGQSSTGALEAVLPLRPKPVRRYS